MVNGVLIGRVHRLCECAGHFLGIIQLRTLRINVNYVLWAISTHIYNQGILYFLNVI